MQYRDWQYAAPVLLLFVAIWLASPATFALLKNKRAA
jgi:hypothetical protein